MHNKRETFVFVSFPHLDLKYGVQCAIFLQKRQNNRLVTKLYAVIFKIFKYNAARPFILP